MLGREKMGSEVAKMFIHLCLYDLSVLSCQTFKWKFQNETEKPYLTWRSWAERDVRKTSPVTFRASQINLKLLWLSRVWNTGSPRTPKITRWSWFPFVSFVVSCPPLPICAPPIHRANLPLKHETLSPSPWKAPFLKGCVSILMMVHLINCIK